MEEEAPWLSLGKYNSAVDEREQQTPLIIPLIALSANDITRCARHCHALPHLDWLIRIIIIISIAHSFISIQLLKQDCMQEMLLVHRHAALVMWKKKTVFFRSCFLSKKKQVFFLNCFLSFFFFCFFEIWYKYQYTSWNNASVGLI